MTRMSNIIRYTNDFAISKPNIQLDDVQREAAHTLDVPVLVLAGPGSGKTQMLAEHAAHILKEDQVHPHNILCLTFTDAGVAAMRKRMLGIIGSDAHKISVHTFHSFCRKVIKENGEYLGRADYVQADHQVFDLTRKMLGQLKSDSLLRTAKGNPNYFHRHLID